MLPLLEFELQFVLQQHLPFTVLKLPFVSWKNCTILQSVATALTVYGIETLLLLIQINDRLFVVTAPTVYGIETDRSFG